MAASRVAPGSPRLDRDGRAPHHQPRGFDLGRIVGDAEARAPGNPASRDAELLAVAHIVDGAVEAELRAAERAGGDVEPAAVERPPWRS